LEESISLSKDLPSSLWRWLVICVYISAFSWLYGILGYRYNHRYTSISVWSIYKDDVFGDFYHYSKLFSLFHTESFFQSQDRFAYPAPAAVIYHVLYSLGRHQLGIYLTFTLLTALVAGYLFFRSLVRAGIASSRAGIFVAGVLLSSWPLVFVCQRANIEVTIWVLASLGIWALLRERPMLAAVLFGLAASIKIYPILLLLLLLSRRMIYAFALGLLVFALSLLFSFWYVGPTISIALHGTLNGITGFIGNYAATAHHNELQADHSFLAAIKSVFSIHKLGFSNFTVLTHLYIPLAAIGAALLFFLRVQFLPVANRILFVMICMVALPPVSYDYTLIHLYVPFALIALTVVHCTQSRTTLSGLEPVLACFAVLFTPQLFLFYNSLHLNGTLKAIALACLLLLLVRYPFVCTSEHPALTAMETA